MLKICIECADMGRTKGIWNLTRTVYLHGVGEVWLHHWMNSNFATIAGVTQQHSMTIAYSFLYSSESILESLTTP